MLKKGTNVIWRADVHQYSASYGKLGRLPFVSCCLLRSFNLRSQTYLLLTNTLSTIPLSFEGLTSNFAQPTRSYL